MASGIAPDRANDPARTPSFKDVQSAHVHGFITHEEAADLNPEVKKVFDATAPSHGHPNGWPADTDKDIKRAHTKARLNTPKSAVNGAGNLKAKSSVAVNKGKNLQYKTMLKSAVNGVGDRK